MLFLCHSVSFQCNFPTSLHRMLQPNSSFVSFPYESFFSLFCTPWWIFSPHHFSLIPIHFLSVLFGNGSFVPDPFFLRHVLHSCALRWIGWLQLLVCSHYFLTLHNVLFLMLLNRSQYWHIYSTVKYSRAIFLAAFSDRKGCIASSSQTCSIITFKIFPLGSLLCMSSVSFCNCTNPCTSHDHQMDINVKRYYFYIQITNLSLLVPSQRDLNILLHILNEKNWSQIIFLNGVLHKGLLSGEVSGTDIFSLRLWGSYWHLFRRMW